MLEEISREAEETSKSVDKSFKKLGILFDRAAQDESQPTRTELTQEATRQRKNFEEKAHELREKLGIPHPTKKPKIPSRNSLKRG